MNEYGVAVDGMIYHDSQVTKDEHGRRFPKAGAQTGYILRGDEFDQLPKLAPEARAFLEAWQAAQGGEGAELTEATPATPTHVATYHTKVVEPEAPAADIQTKADEPAADDERRVADSNRNRHGGRG